MQSCCKLLQKDVEMCCIYRSLCLEASQTKTAVVSFKKTAHVLLSLMLDEQECQTKKPLRVA